MNSQFLFLLSIGCAFLFPCTHCLDFLYDFCHNFTRCGSIYIKYPLGLWSYGCGNPNYQLTCFNDNPQLTIGGNNYTVLDVSYPNHTLTIVSDKLLYFCDPSDYSTFSLNSSKWTVSDEYFSNITIFQFLRDTPPEIFSLFTPLYCNNNSWYYCSIPPWTASIYASEEEEVQVPVRRGTNVTADPHFLLEGFQIKWHDEDSNDQSCKACASSGGLCGYNYKVPGTDFLCYCQAGPSESKCKIGRKHLGAIIGGSVGGAVLVFAALAFMGPKFLHYKKHGHLSNRSLLSMDLSNDGSTNRDTIIQANTGELQIFHYEALKQATNDFSDANQLGDGGFGCVYQAKLNDGRTAAVKKLYHGNSKRVEQFINEVKILSSLNHPNLVRLYGCTSSEGPDLLLVYEFAPNGTLAEHLHGERKSNALCWDIRLKICIETAQALAFLHSQKPPIFHRDVKSSNILLDEHFTVKVADFGLSRFVPPHVTHVSTAPQGTPGYLDPDYHQCFQLTEKSDVYSFGVVLVEIISAKLAVDITRKRKEIGLANMAVCKIQQGALHELVDPNLELESNKEVRAMVTAVAEVAFRCLAAEKDDRPDMEEIVVLLEQIREKELMSHSRNQDGQDTKLCSSIGSSSPTSVQEMWPSTPKTPETSSNQE